MLEKRSCRRTAVSYASAFGNEDSGDEDFIHGKAPPSKRSKANAEEKSKKANSQPSSSGEGKSKPKRKKLDDKLFERELKLAMEMSMQEIGSTSSKEELQDNDTSDFQDTPQKNSASERVESLKLSRHDIHSPPKSPCCMSPPLLLKEDDKCILAKDSVKQSTMPSLPRAPAMKGPSDEIEYLGTVTDDEDLKKKVQHRRTSGRTARKKIQLEPDSSEDEASSEFEEADEENDSDEEFEEDCDYGKKYGKKNKKGAAKNVKTKKDNNSVNKKSSTVKRKQTVIKSPSSSTSLLSSSSSPLSTPSSSSRKGIPESSKSSSSQPSSSLMPPQTTSTDTTKVASATVSGRSQTSEPSHTSVKKPLVPQPQISNLSSPLSSKLPIKQQIWNPPVKVSNSDRTSSLKVVSPPSGIRIGLSRNQKVKPLHPTVKAQH